MSCIDYNSFLAFFYLHLKKNSPKSVRKKEKKKKKIHPHTPILAQDTQTAKHDLSPAENPISLILHFKSLTNPSIQPTHPPTHPSQLPNFP
jgi:hypothetical protein